MNTPTLNASRKIKKTPVGEIPVDWGVTSLTAILRTPPAYGANVCSVDYDPQKTARYIRITDIDEFGNLLDDRKVGIPLADAADYILSDGDLVIARSGATVGKSFVYRQNNGECAFAGYLIRFRVDESRYSLDFLAQYLRSPYFATWVSKTLRAGAQPNISATEYSKLHLPNPAVEEQRRIAAVLGAWDRALTGLEKLLAAKQQFRQVLMQELLTGNKRFKQFGTDKWKVHRLSDLLERVFRPVTLSDDTPLKLISIRRRAGGLFFRGSFTAREFKTLDLNRIEAGDFLVSKRQVTHGSLAMVRKDFEGMHVSNEYVIFRCKVLDKLYLPFFDWLSRSPRMWHMAYLASNGVHIEKLIFDADDFLKEKIALPPSLTEQQKIVEVLETSDAEIHILERELAVLRDQKRGLMQKLLTGKVRLKV